MPAKVILWIDYVSPYAFVAKAGAYDLERDYEVALEWRPYTLDIASFQQSVEARDPHHWRRVRYAYMDARRFANKQGLTLMGPKKIFYARPINAGMLYAQQHGVSAPTTTRPSSASGAVSSMRRASRRSRRC